MTIPERTNRARTACAADRETADRYRGLTKTMAALAAIVLHVTLVSLAGSAPAGSQAGLQYLAQDLVVGAGETRALPPGTHVFNLLRLDDGATVTLTGTTQIDARKLVANGSTQVRYEGTPSNTDARHLRLTVLDATEVAGSLTIDGSGAHARAPGGSGEPGMSMDVTLVHGAGAIDLAHRFSDGRGMVAGRLNLFSRGGVGSQGHTGASEITEDCHWIEGNRGAGFRICKDRQVGHRGGTGGRGGNGGRVTVRVVIPETVDGAEWLGGNRVRDVGGENYSTVRTLYAEGLGVDIHVDPGAVGPAGSGGPGNPPGQNGSAGSAGSDGLVRWEIVDFATVADEFPEIVGREPR